MSDGVKRRGECLPAGVAPSTQQWKERRLIFDLVAADGSTFVPPTIATLLGSYAADGDDPGIAVVSLHAIGSVRELGEVQAVPALDVLRQAAQLPPIGAQFAPAINQAVGPRNTGRGVSVPQFRVTFQDGTPDAAVVYADGNSVLSHPANEVKIEAITPALLWDGIGDAPANLEAGIIADVIVAPSVAWGEKEGSAAPMGMATYSQFLGATSGNPVLFERPPFARRVMVIQPTTVGSRVQFRSSPTTVIANLPGVATTGLQSIDVPALATHLAVILGAGAAPGTPVHCIWEIGTR